MAYSSDINIHSMGFLHYHYYYYCCYYYYYYSPEVVIIQPSLVKEGHVNK